MKYAHIQTLWGFIKSCVFTLFGCTKMSMAEMYQLKSLGHEIAGDHCQQNRNEKKNELVSAYQMKFNKIHS